MCSCCWVAALTFNSASHKCSDPASAHAATLAKQSTSVGGIMVSIAAFQAVDPGSIPGRRNFLDPIGSLHCLQCLQIALSFRRDFRLRYKIRRLSMKILK